METVICINVYGNALTRGKEYEVLDRGFDELHIDQIKVKGDSGNVDWYPAYCFTKNRKGLFEIKTITIDDQIRNAYLDTVETTLVLRQGTREIRRWCYFLTPAYVYKMFNIPEPFTAGPHGIFIPVLTEEAIKKALYYLESQNQILECTRPLRDTEDSDDIDSD
jgi:hypothetical protein